MYIKRDINTHNQSDEQVYAEERMSSSSSSEEGSTAAPQDTNTTTGGDMDDDDMVDSGGHTSPPSPPMRYTLKQAFYKAYSTTPPKHENDMLLTEIPREDKTKLVDYYEYANNPSPHWDRYYTQYHAFEVIVFKKHAAETWDAIVDFFKDNHHLSKRYSKNLSYMLQKQRQCQNSYSTVILMLIAYPRHRQKNREIAEQFIIDSGLKSNFPIWGVAACKSYAYLSPEEYIKLLNTHAEGCFVSHSYPRFRAFTNEWESRMTRRRHDDDDEEDGDDDSNSFTSDDDDCDGGDDSSTTTTTSDDDMSCCSSSDDAAADDAAAVDVKDGGAPNTTRRFFSPPHPSLAAVSSTNVSTKAVSSARLSSPGGSNDDDGGTSPVVVADKRNGGKKNVKFSSSLPTNRRPQKKMLNRFYRATGFMSHANCGLHKLTVVAKDIHKQTNTLIFHKRSFDRRYEKDIVRSKDYLLPHHSGGAPRNNTTNNRKRKLLEVAAIATTPVIVAHQQQQQQLQSKKNRKNN